MPMWSCATWWLDRHEKEPLWLLMAVFFWGAVPAFVLSVACELILEIPLHSLLESEGHFFVSATFIAPPVEEILKAVPLLIVFLLYRKEFDGLIDGLLYGAMAGFGFAMTEDFFYFLSVWFDGGAPAVAVLFFLPPFRVG